MICLMENGWRRLSDGKWQEAADKKKIKKIEIRSDDDLSDGKWQEAADKKK